MHGDGVNIIFKSCVSNDATDCLLVHFQAEHATAVATETGKIASSTKQLGLVRYCCGHEGSEVVKISFFIIFKGCPCNTTAYGSIYRLNMGQHFPTLSSTLNLCVIDFVHRGS